MGRLDGKVAIVTGAARGIGAATARLFASEGAKVVIADVLSEGAESARAIGSHALFVATDVSKEKDWQALDEQTRAAFGPAQILVNNAGVNCIGEILTLDFEAFERTVRINLGGAFLGMKTIARGMIAAGGGSIVNISSSEGLTGRNALGAYSASKWGVRGLSKVAAMELSHRGVRVNSVHPGPVDTPMGNPEGLTPAQLGRIHATLPIGRVGRPDDIAQVCLFLASDESAYMTGAELAVDGGMTAGSYLTFLPGIPAALQEETR